MKLRTKLNLIALVVTACMLVIVSYSMRSTVMKSYLEVERDVFDHNMTIFRENINEELVHLETALSDWAKWDASYDFIHGDNDTFIEENISISAYRDLDLNYIAIYSPDNILLYGMHYNEDEDALEPISEAVSDSFIAFRHETGVLRVGEELILASTMGITDNDATVAEQGLMVFAYTLDEDVQARIERENDLELTVEVVDNYEIPNMRNPYEVYQSVSMDTDISVGHVLVKIRNTEEAIDMATVMGNKIQTLGGKYMNRVILNLLITLAVFELIIHISIGKMVVNRIIELNDQVNAITQIKSSSERVDVRGVDELGELSRNINVMLSEIEDMHKEVEYHAYYDPMTGLYNRRMGFEKLSESITAVKVGHEPLSIAYLDLNDLKKTNDKFGHKQGDALIKDTVELLNASIAVHKHIVRMGGDEFMIVLPGLDAALAESVMDDVIKLAVEVNANSGKVYDISFSYGVAQYQDGMDIDHFVEQADEKMYRAKKLYREKKRMD